MSKWEVSADMMSEEEDNEDETFICHRYAWRSEGFNRIVEKLEECIAKNSQKT